MFDLRAIITALMYETKPLERRTAVSPRRGDMMMVNAKYTGGPCIVYNFIPEEKRHNMQKSAYGSKNLFHFDNQNCTLYEDPMQCVLYMLSLFGKFFTSKH